MLEVAGREVRLSNPAKVYFPKPGWTKLDIATYYVEVADAALVHLRERPTVMKRFVNGIQEEPIWQKRVPRNIPEWLETATVWFPSGRTAEELVANDEAHLVWAVNLGVIDFNPWPARRADLDRPDELRVDLDPDRRRRLGRGAPHRDGRQATSWRSTACAATRRRRARRASTSTCASSRCGRASRSAAPRSRWPARWSAARPTSRRASGGRRSATACSSTTTRTRATAPSPPATRSARPPTRGSRARSPGTRCPPWSRRTCASTPCPPGCARPATRPPTST